MLSACHKRLQAPRGLYNSTDSARIWGNVTTLNFTVTGPYGGDGALSFFPKYQFGYVTLEPNGTSFSYSARSRRSGGIDGRPSRA
jgi:hypothetical protein